MLVFVFYNLDLVVTWLTAICVEFGSLVGCLLFVVIVACLCCI